MNKTFKLLISTFWALAAEEPQVKILPSESENEFRFTALRKNVVWRCTPDGNLEIYYLHPYIRLDRQGPTLRYLLKDGKGIFQADWQGRGKETSLDHIAKDGIGFVIEPEERDVIEKEI